MLELPILNVRLQACSEDWQQMMPTQQGRHCRSCDREVVDLTTATQADLDAARAASADGRLCGRFLAEQLTRPLPVRLRPKLRRFVVALVLVCGLGMSAGAAWAQVRKAALNTRFEPTTELQLKTPEELSPLALTETEQALAPVGSLPQPPPFLGMVIEQMPEFKGGMKGLRSYLEQTMRYPDSTTASGKVFVNFLVTKTGAVTNARVIKGVDPRLDAEALRVVRQMPAWEPGQQSWRPVEVTYTLPITFSREPDMAPQKRKGKRRVAHQ
ncbi:energy transducer TonB [Hymenobacter metallicola]|nr:energy transducer TonB [Hymenobacter metallicola]